MKEKTKFVAFSTQKGGAGKTTLTVLAASYLHYVKGFNVAVIDCDYPQHLSLIHIYPACRKLRRASHAAVGRGNDTPFHHARGGVP